MGSKGFIFDLDGVIVDTAKYHYLSWKKLANTLGFDIDEEQNEELKGVSRAKCLQIILKWGNVRCSEEEFKQFMEAKNQEYLSYVNQMTSEEILPGASELLTYLSDRNQLIALGSASKNAKIILKSIGLYHKFRSIVDGSAVRNTKPDPEVFVKAASEIQTAPGNCIVFEDSIAGIEAANKAGMTSLGIGNRNILGHADYVFTDLGEISFSFIDKLIENESELHRAR